MDVGFRRRSTRRVTESLVNKETGQGPRLAPAASRFRLADPGKGGIPPFADLVNRPKNRRKLLLEGPTKPLGPAEILVRRPRRGGKSRSVGMFFSFFPGTRDGTSGMVSVPATSSTRERDSKVPPARRAAESKFYLPQGFRPRANPAQRFEKPPPPPRFFQTAWFFRFRANTIFKPAVRARFESFNIQVSGLEELSTPKHANGLERPRKFSSPSISLIFLLKAAPRNNRHGGTTIDPFGAIGRGCGRGWAKLLRRKPSFSAIGPLVPALERRPPFKEKRCSVVPGKMFPPAHAATILVQRPKAGLWARDPRISFGSFANFSQFMDQGNNQPRLSENHPQSAAAFFSASRGRAGVCSRAEPARRIRGSRPFPSPTQLMGRICSD